jgi:cytochrome c oxidase assembly protein subunit 15
MRLISLSQHIAKYATLLAFIVVVVGAYTRLTDAGLGCPDWPGCYGQLLVPDSEIDLQTATTLYPEQPVEKTKAQTEMFHRYLASSLGLMILVLGFLGLKSRERRVKFLSLALVGLVMFQGLLGMWTVTLRLLPAVVMGHLLGGLTTLSLLWLLYLMRSAPKYTPVIKNNALKFLSVLSLLAVIVQLALGGWTSANYAALACPDFPSCLAQYWPKQLDFNQAFNLFAGIGLKFPTLAIDNDARVTIHYMHRLWAIVVSCLVLLTCIQLWREKLSRTAWVLLGILCLQIGLGITNVLAKLPLGIAVMHNGVGALLLLTLVTLNFRLYSNHHE